VACSAVGGATEVELKEREEKNRKHRL